VAREFNPNNKGDYNGTWSSNMTAGSFHPVFATAANNLGAVKLTNLVTTNFAWSTTSRNLMTCSDCHGADSTTDPSGPHGSAAKFILRGPNTKWDSTLVLGTSGMPAGTFCANCHDSTFKNSRTTFHTSSHHTGRSFPCFNCHVAIPHGSQRPGILISPVGTAATIPAAPITDAAPYNQSTGGSNSLYIKSYPTNGSGTFDENQCGCNGTSHG
jgi:cytochrome c553